MIYRIDIDGVLVREKPTFQRSLAEPIPDAIERVRKLKLDGHTVIIETSRGWAEYEMTKHQLLKLGVPHDELIMGMPIADKIVNDRAVSSMDQLWDDPDDYLIYLHRMGTKAFLEELSKKDLPEPILEVGPILMTGNWNKVFQRMPETFVDSRELFKGKDYRAMDVDSSTKPDILGSFVDAINLIEPHSVNTLILMNVLEHIPELWNVPGIIGYILKPGGRAYIVTPWNVRWHGPSPHCWAISDHGYQALFNSGGWKQIFEIESIAKIELPNRPLHPVGVKVVIKKI